MDKPLVSVIILNYNGIDVVNRCLRSVLLTNYPCFEVILVDNASTDGSLQYIIDKFGRNERLKIVRSSVNRGFAGGNNLGLNYASGSYITLLNNDTEVQSDWLTEAIAVAEHDKRVGVVQSKLFFWYNPQLLESAGAFIDRCGYGFESGFAKDIGYDTVEEIFYANGAAVTIRKSALMQIYPLKLTIFDDDFFFAYEDVDLSWRMWLSGFKSVLAPTSIVFHRRSTTTSRRRDMLVFHHSKNRLLTLLKNYDLFNLLKYFPLLITLETLRAVSCLASSDVRCSFAIFRGFIWNVTNLRKNWEKRLIVQRLVRRKNDNFIIPLMEKVNPARLIYNQRFYREFSRKTGVNIVR